MAKKTIPQKKVSGVRQTILAIAIAIVLALFVGFGIYAVNPGPKSENYCDYSKAVPPVLDQASCDSLGGTWNAYPQPVACAPNEKTCAQGYCDMYAKCNQAFQDASKIYNKGVFIAATILGLIAVLLGGVILQLESVATGIMGGGVISLIYGIIRYWVDASNVLRVIILGVALVVLIWIGYKKLNPNK